MACDGITYVPIPSHLWYRENTKCSEYNPGEQAMLMKGNILQYKKNSSNLTRNQIYSKIARGYWINRNTTWATQQNDGYSNPNTKYLKRIGAINIAINPETGQIIGPTTLPVTCPTNPYQPSPILPTIGGESSNNVFLNSNLSEKDFLDQNFLDKIISNDFLFNKYFSNTFTENNINQNINYNSSINLALPINKKNINPKNINSKNINKKNIIKQLLFKEKNNNKKFKNQNITKQIIIENDSALPYVQPPKPTEPIVIQDGGELICSITEIPCTDYVKKTISQQFCNPTTDSDVPGELSLLCWNDTFQTWYPRQKTIMTNSGNKWPTTSGPPEDPTYFAATGFKTT